MSALLNQYKSDRAWFNLYWVKVNQNKLHVTQHQCVYTEFVLN